MTEIISKLLIALTSLSSLLAPNFGAVPKTFNSVQEVQSAEESYYSKSGEYAQILLNGMTPEGKSAETVLGKKLPKGMQIYIWETPKKEKGYQIYYTEPSATST